jgi:hypothetical protein
MEIVLRKLVSGVTKFKMAGLKLWVKIFLFISSFSPLAIIWGLRFKEYEFNILKWNINALWLILIIILFSIFLLIFVLEFSRRSNNPKKVKIKSLENLNRTHVEYLLTYVFAFLPINTGSILAFVIFMLVLLVVYLKSNLIYVNPLLTILGYNILKINDENENNLIVITRRESFIKGETISLSVLSKDIFVEIKENEERNRKFNK